MSKGEDSKTESGVKIDPPGQFSFVPEDWKKYKQRFVRYMNLANKNLSNEEKKDCLIYCMGDRAEDILVQFPVDLTYESLLEHFDNHFSPKKNVIYQRSKFNQRYQKEGERFDDFLTDLHVLAEHCDYGTLKEQLIRDRIVVGLRDKKTRDRLLLKSDLTLEAATLISKQAEIQEAESKLMRREEENVEINRLKYGKAVLGGKNNNCWFCGKERHQREKCPAAKATCHNCQRQGHFAKMCRSKTMRRLEEEKDKEFEFELKDEEFSDYLALMKERDARYTLFFENVELHQKLRELDGSSQFVDTTYGDPVVLRIALDRCREELSSVQRELNKMKEEYVECVPLREHDGLTIKFYETTKTLDALQTEHQTLQEAFKRIAAAKKYVEEELAETKERCRELERAGTPRPQWELCADFIGGGRDRWWQLAQGLSSRETLRVLLKELGPAAESDHLEYFDGLGTDPAIPPYLRYEGKVRNLRLSRREVSVMITDIWLGKQQNGTDISMQEYVTKYFEDRYQQPSVRAEWAYNLCAGAEQMLDEPQVKLFWGVLHGHLSEHIYWGHRTQWLALKDQLYKQSKNGETISIDEFEKIAKVTFPLKSEVDIKNLVDVMRKQLKLKINTNEIYLDKLFQENEEGFDRVEFARELYRQRQLAQDKYIREVVAELGGRRASNKAVGVEALKRAFAIVDPAIDHIRMDRYIRWAFGASSGDLSAVGPRALHPLAARLAAGDVERQGPRAYTTRRSTYK